MYPGVPAVYPRCTKLCIVLLSGIYGFLYLATHTPTVPMTFNEVSPAVKEISQGKMAPLGEHFKFLSEAELKTVSNLWNEWNKGFVHPTEGPQCALRLLEKYAKKGSSWAKLGGLQGKFNSGVMSRKR